MHVKTILFDLDDTLYTDWDNCHQTALQYVDNYGTNVLNLEPQTMKNAFIKGRDQVIARLGQIGSAHNRLLFAQAGLEMLGINPIVHAPKLHEAYWNGVKDSMISEPNVIQIFDKLKSKGIAIAICTNMMTDIQIQKLCILKLENKIDFLITSEDAGVDKPMPQVFEYALAKSNSNAHTTLMIGDNPDHDILGAKQVGIEGIWICRKPHQADKYKDKIKNIVFSLDEAMDIV